MLRTISTIARILSTKPNKVLSSRNPLSFKSRVNPTTVAYRSLNSCSSPHTKEAAVQFEILPSQYSDIDETNIELSDVKIRLADQDFIINLTSLRDFCFCPKCLHSNSRQKLFIPKDFRKEKFMIHEIKFVHEAGKVIVNWSDGHCSAYSIDLLKKIKYFSDKEGSQWKERRVHELPDDDLYRASGRLGIKKKTWDILEIKNNMSTVNYELLVSDSSQYDKESIFNANKTVHSMDPTRIESMYQLTRSLVTYGLAKLVNVPQREQEILNVARCLAYERPTGYGTIFDVVVEPSDDINLAYSALEFDLHTDLPYRESMPGVQLLHCITNSPDGGESYFSDGYYAAKKLQLNYPQLFRVLTQFPTTFSVRDPYRNVKFRRQYPIVSLDYQGEIHEIHYSPFHLPPLGPRDDIKMFYLALDKFTQYLQSNEQKLITKMECGDLYIFNNRRVLHGRSSYDPTKSKRFLQGCYMDWDEITSLHEKLHTCKIK